MNRRHEDFQSSALPTELPGLESLRGSLLRGARQSNRAAPPCQRGALKQAGKRLSASRYFVLPRRSPFSVLRSPRRPHGPRCEQRHGERPAAFAAENGERRTALPSNRKRRELLRGVSRPAFLAACGVSCRVRAGARPASGRIHPGRWQAVVNYLGSPAPRRRGFGRQAAVGGSSPPSTASPSWVVPARKVNERTEQLAVRTVTSRGPGD